MPEFETNVDIDPGEFLDACKDRDIKDLISYLIEDGHIPDTNKDTTVKIVSPSQAEIDFLDRLKLLSENYYRLSVEEEKTILDITKKFI